MNRNTERQTSGRDRRVRRRTALRTIGGIGLASVLPLSTRATATDGTDPPSVEWSRTYDDFDGVTSLVRTDGGYALVGTLSNDEGSRAGLAELDAEGTLDRRWTFETYRYPSDIVEEEDGHTFAAISFASGSDDRFPVVVRLDSSGEVTWETVVEPPAEYDFGENVVPTDLARTSDGGYLLAGYVAAVYRRALAAKLGADGTIEWIRVLEPDLADEPWHRQRSLLLSLAPAGDGYAAAGYLAIGSPGADDDYREWPWLVTFDAAGEVTRRWTVEFEGESGAATTLLRTDDGYALGGRRFASASDYTAQNRADAFLLETTEEGCVQWCERYGEEEGIDALNELVRTTDGRYAFAGYARNYPGPYGWLVKTNARGRVEWEWLDETPSDVNSLIVTDEGFALGGTADPLTGWVTTLVLDK